MYVIAESEICWWYTQRDAALGISGIGFEGGSQSVWDEARSGRAHGFSVGDEGEITVMRTGHLSTRLRANLAREAKIGPVIYALNSSARLVLAQAWDTAGATRRVLNLMASRDASGAPLVGLALTTPAMCEVAQKQKLASPTAKIRWLDEVVASGVRRAIGVIRAQALERYVSTLAMYESHRLERAQASRDERAREMAELRARLVRR